MAEHLCAKQAILGPIPGDSQTLLIKKKKKPVKEKIRLTAIVHVASIVDHMQINMHSKPLVSTGKDASE